MPSDESTVRSYDKFAQYYDTHVSDPEDSIFHSQYEKPAIRAELPDLKGLKVISIGCGSGADARWLKDNGADSVTGIDISSGLIEIARAKHDGIDFHVMDMEKLEFPDESFDLAYSSLAIHYLDDWMPALKEAYRILKAGGQYIFSCGHPIDSAMELSNGDGKHKAILGRIVIDDTGERIIHGDYLVPAHGGIKPLDGNLGEMEIRIYHRPISKMIEHIVGSGFTIEKLVEPQPSEKMKQNEPQRYEQLSKTPVFMVWVLKKP